MSARKDPPLSRSFVIQVKVVRALLMREIITRYGRHNIGFLWLFVEPMLFTLGVTALWTLVKATHGSNLPIVAFAITGYSSVLLWRNVANRCSKAIEPNLSLLYHRNVLVIDLFASRVILEIAGATISCFVLTLVFSAAGMMDLPQDVLIAMEAWFLLAWFASALGLVVGSISERSEAFDRIWHTVTYLLFPLSGAAFMISWLPVQAREFLLWIPMVHATEMLRHGYFGDIVTTYENVEYLIKFNVGLTLLGFALVRDTSRRVAPE